jgi:uncharacterized protein
LANETEPASNSERGATVVITQRVRAGQQAAYEAWLGEVSPIAKSYEGFMDWQLIRPVAGVTATYTIILRFDTRDNLQNWMYSEERKRFIDQVRPLLAADDDFFIRSGLDFWFTPEGAQAKVPVRWKQFVLTWSAIYPLSLLTSLVIVPLVRLAGVPQDRYFEALYVSGIIVFFMVYLVMPRYTKLVQRWLFKSDT